MAKIRPFPAFRPVPTLVEKVAARPYDVMNSEEARMLACDNPYSFLHVDKAEIDLPKNIDLYDAKVYATARQNLYRMIHDGVFLHEQSACMYVYKQVMNGRSQIGIVACSSIDDYLNNVIKKHELTRKDKETDRSRHVETCAAQTGPIFLTYHARASVNIIVEKVMQEQPIYDFVSDNVQQVVWCIDDPAVIQTLVNEIDAAGSTYIADGHHRAASAVRVGQKLRQQNPNHTGEEEYNYFLSVLFPDDQLHIMEYNRVVNDLNGLSKEQFLAQVEQHFHIQPYLEEGPCHPAKPHTFGMYLDHSWYLLTAKAGSFDDTDPISKLDVSILQNNLLAPVLGIADPRTDNRIKFIGGIRGLEDLERRVDNSAAVAFAMYATSIGELMEIADAGKIMPPKSTWFEPKLLSGIFIHPLGN